jgi:ubiquitin carboxyl-terminal hydrolase 5/13
MEFGTLTPGTHVENEECVLCFNDFDSEDGVNICLKCFRCLCNEHAQRHAKEDGHLTFLNRKRITEVSDADPNKLAIGVEGGFSDVKYKYQYQLRLYSEDSYDELPEELLEDNDEAKALVEKIKQQANASQADAVDSWELQVVECSHVKELKQPEEKVPEPKMKCACCDIDKNLWLCLSCGYVGCSRKNFDGSGGNNHALDHFRETGHPVSVKMGTITPDGRADLFCYACDETVTDSRIGEHLQKLSIDVQSAVKTELSTIELNVEINKSWDFDTVSKDGKEFDLFTGPNSLGLRNLGNTCYFNSVIQLLTAIPDFQKEYTTQECEKARWADPKRQFYRMFHEMLHGQRKSVSPRLLRTVICKERPDFMSTQQQDAAEFYLYLHNYIKIHNPKTSLTRSEFDCVNAMQCSSCAEVETAPRKDQAVFYLTPKSHLDAEEKVISIKDLIDESLTHVIPERKCDKCGKLGATSKQLFKNFPDYLFVVVVLDTISPNGVIKKMNLRVDFDPNNFDISEYRTDIKESVDEKKVDELMNFGFSRSQCVRALQNVATVEEAAQWIIDNPMEQSPAVQQVMEMGFSESEAREALEETQGNVSFAIEWLFGPRTKHNTAKTDGEGKYELIGFLQHKGTSALCGHYVATIKRDGKWVLYNDEKVAVYPDDEPPEFGKGYLYLFHRK